MSNLLVQNIKHTNGTTSMVVNSSGHVATDTIKGNSTAGSISVVGEGGSTTTNLQQGLCKAWANFDGGASGAASRDTFNVSGMTDNGAGNYTVAINNDMSNANFSIGDSIGDYDNTSESIAWSFTHTQAAGTMSIISAHFDGGSGQDRSSVCMQAFGDLA